MELYRKYRYKNLTFLFISVIVAFLLFKNSAFRSFLLQLGTLGYFGAAIAGMLFVSTFTVTLGIVILLILARNLSPVEIGIIAGLGAVAGDLIIFQFIKNKGLISEIKHIFAYFGGEKISHLLRTKYFSWTLPVIGALIIASPLPDELGVTLMEISKMKTYKFILISFILNSISIFLVISASLTFKFYL